MRLLLGLIVACQPYRTLYQGTSAYVTGSAGFGAPVFVGLSTGELAEYSLREDGKVFARSVATGNAAAGAFSMRASKRRVAWLEPAGTGEMVDVTKLPTVAVGLGATLAVAASADQIVWLATGGGLFQLKDGSEEPEQVAALTGLSPQQDPPVLATDGTFVYFVTVGGALRRYALGARQLDPNFGVDLDGRALGLHVDEDVYVVLESKADSFLAASGIAAPARLLRIGQAVTKTVSESAASQGSRNNVWVVSDRDYFYWCELTQGRTRAKRTHKRDETTVTLGVEQGCPFAVTDSDLLLAAPGVVMVGPKAP